MDLMQMLVDSASNYNSNDFRPKTHAYDAVRHPKNQWRDIMLTQYDFDKKCHRKVRSSRFAGFAANMNNTEFEFKGRLYRFEHGQLHCVGMCEETNPQRFSIR